MGVGTDKGNFHNNLVTFLQTEPAPLKLCIWRYINQIIIVIIIIIKTLV